jgi:hypothetical protein
MRRGDVLYTHGWGNSKGIFEDGTKVSHQVIRILRKSGKINYPAHMSIHSPYTLAEPPEKI